MSIFEFEFDFEFKFNFWFSFIFIFIFWFWFLNLFWFLFKFLSLFLFLYKSIVLLLILSANKAFIFWKFISFVLFSLLINICFNRSVLQNLFKSLSISNLFSIGKINGNSNDNSSCFNLNWFTIEADWLSLSFMLLLLSPLLLLMLLLLLFIDFWKFRFISLIDSFKSFSIYIFNLFKVKIKIKIKFYLLFFLYHHYYQFRYLYSFF